jgi:hypothetical protein
MIRSTTFAAPTVPLQTDARRTRRPASRAAAGGASDGSVECSLHSAYSLPLDSSGVSIVNTVGLLTLAAVVFVTVGDPLFVHLIRARVPPAFLAAGSPSPVWIFVLTPIYFGAYMGYVLRRDFRVHLVRGSWLYLMASSLYIAHLFLVGLAVFWTCLLAWWFLR